ncbi:MAG: cadherin-like domain-containing protein [Halioglobus sp.]
MREITFQIPGHPPLTIHAMEQTDGTLLFELDAVGKNFADIRGLYFSLADTSLNDSLQVEGPDLTGQEYRDVSRLGPGNNLKGKGWTNSQEGAPYDVGLNFGSPGIGKDTVDSTTFVLSSTTGEPLTLDLIANVEFGARVQGNSDRGGPQKNTMISPAAPDAIDDTDYTLEDTAVSVDVVANDTDADGDALSVIEFTAASNGTLQIVDNKILYTPNEHWSGQDSFTYRIYDGDGGYDWAEAVLTVEAVADQPNLSLNVRAGENVNEIIVDITSSLVDTDGSETYILSFSDLPAGVTLVGANGAGEILLPTGADSITLELAENTSYDFDFSVLATSTEINPGAGEGDQATSTETINVEVQSKLISEELTFVTSDTPQGSDDNPNASMWTSGDEWSFEIDEFLGLDLNKTKRPNDDNFIEIGAEIDFQAGLEFYLRLEGGDVYAESPWMLNFDSTFNRTTDALQIDTSAFLSDTVGTFTTDGPSLEMSLGMLIDLRAGLNFLEVADINIIDHADDGDGIFIDTGPIRQELFSYDSDDGDTVSDGEGDIPDIPYTEITLQWPNLQVSDAQPLPAVDSDGNPLGAGDYYGIGTSTDFLTVDIDVDEILSELPYVPPLGFAESVSALGQSAGFSADIVDIHAKMFMNFIQEFTLETGGTVMGLLDFEGSDDSNNTLFTFGDTLNFGNASELDANGDGHVSFDVTELYLVDTKLTNKTDVGLDVGGSVDLLQGTIWYDTTFGGDSYTLGPAWHWDERIPVESFEVFSDTFDFLFDGNELLADTDLFV